jgi:ribonucleotide reductase beta subunit family protein with ferritin-like domain
VAVPEDQRVSTATAAQISYTDLYARWERGNWSATQIDFSEDREQWRTRFSDLQRRAALWNYTLFFHGEDEVADDLSALIEAAPLEEQKYFLATQQVDEARHAVFFKRFMEEVCELGDGSVAGTLAATQHELTWGWKQTFAILKRVTGELHADKSGPALARAVTMYHLLVEATLAQPGQHFIEDYLNRDDLLPGFREGMKNVAADEQRHIAFGVRLLHDLHQADPQGVKDAVADLLREVLPLSVSLFVPPGWDRGYTECFGFTLEEIYAEGMRSLDSKMRAAGLPLESLPQPLPIRVDLSIEERAVYGLSLVQHGILGDGTTPATPDEATMRLLFDTIAHGVDHSKASKPITLQWEFTDAEPWHLRVDNGSTNAERGLAPSPDLVLKVAFKDWVDVVGRRADARRLLLTRRLKPRGSLRVFAMLPRLFP